VVLAVIGSAWIIWLIFDINKYTDMMRKYWQNEGGSGSSQTTSFNSFLSDSKKAHRLIMT
jgi:hypothetical protein